MVLRLINAAVLSLAPTHEARDNAPGTFADLWRAPSIVYAGASDRTIYRDRAVNWAFRAWHDQTHLAFGHDFTPAGEALTCEAQALAFMRAYPSAPEAMVRLWLDTEINVQVRYLEAHGAFPDDQTGLDNSLAAWLG